MAESTEELRKMLTHAEQQFLKSWAPADAEFWKRRMKELKEKLKLSSVYPTERIRNSTLSRR